MAFKLELNRLYTPAQADEILMLAPGGALSLGLETTRRGRGVFFSGRSIKTYADNLKSRVTATLGSSGPEAVILLGYAVQCFPGLRAFTSAPGCAAREQSRRWHMGAHNVL